VFTPPDIGLGTVDLLKHEYVLGFDLETFKLPEVEFKTLSGKKNRLTTRKITRVVCSSWAGRDALPYVFTRLHKEGHVVYRHQGKTWAAVADRQGTEEISDWLLREDVLLVGHNIAGFDFAHMLHMLPDPQRRAGFLRILAEGRVCDTYIREKLLGIAFDYTDYCPILNAKRGLFSLAGCIKRHFQIDISADKKSPDAWRLRYHELDGVPLKHWPKAAVDYPMDDAEWALSLAFVQARIGSPSFSEHMDPTTTERGGVVDEVRQCRASLALYCMSAWSVICDGDTVDEWEGELEVAIEKIVSGAQRAGFVRLNGKRNMKIMRELVEKDYNRQGREVPHTDPSAKFPNGQIKTSADVLLKCKTPELRAWGEASGLLKDKTTYLLPAKLGVKGNLPYNYDPLKNTGRTSSYKTNTQNPPRKGKFRECNKARPGKILCSSDYTAAESCGLAQLHLWVFGRSALADLLNGGVCIHCFIGAHLAGVSLETFMEWYEDKNHPQFYVAKNVYRQAAKVANFGIPGGLVAKTLVAYALGLGVNLYEIAIQVDPTLVATDDEDEQFEIAKVYAQHVIDTWKEVIPEGAEYMEMVNNAVDWGETFTFKQFVSERNRGGCTYTSGCNTGFQGIVADGSKEAMWRLLVLCYLPPEYSVPLLEGLTWRQPEKLREWAEALYGVRPVLFIHDEIIAEGPEETAHVWAWALSEVMVEGLQMFIPDVTIEAKPALMRRWYKGAEEAYDETGKLVAWEPTVAA